MDPATPSWDARGRGACAFRETSCPKVRFGTELHTPPQTAPLPGMLPQRWVPVGSHICPVQRVGTSWWGQ